MAQAPALVLIARHGPRLDAADPTWILSTPTPYDPPLTYGGWNQSRSLGLRIASILHAREQEGYEAADGSHGVVVHDFSLHNGTNGREERAPERESRKRKRRHKVVIHTSPFLRCLQTSVAIAAGMAQFQPPPEPASRSGATKGKPPSSLHSASPRLRAMDGTALALPPIAEPKHDLAHAIARRALHEPKRHRKARLRVDAFLGEWLNPEYFDHITPPPPSAMMVAGAKAELMQNEPVELFTPTISTKSSHSSLWGASTAQRQRRRESTVGDYGKGHDAVLAPVPRRSRTSSFDSIDTNHSSMSGRRSPTKSSHVASSVPKPETTVYAPPTPQYAVSGADHIPRGYVSHARQACVNVDYQWDSSRPPHDWGDGGELGDDGEDWNAMYKRFRRGLNHLVDWYSRHDVADRPEDSLGFDQAEKHEDEEQEDLVLIMVTHGAGSNALIRALTGHSALIDVGTASLTMAERRDDAPLVGFASPPSTPSTSSDSLTLDPTADHNHGRRLSVDLDLSSIYEMKLKSSSDHLRPGVDPTRLPTSFLPADLRTNIQPRARFGSGSPKTSGTHTPVSPWSFSEARNNTNSTLGSIRRPSTANVAAPGSPVKSSFLPTAAHFNSAASGSSGDTSPSFGPSLWAPPTSRTPLLPATHAEEKLSLFTQLSDKDGRISPGQDLVLDFSTSPPDSRPTSSAGISKAETGVGFAALNAVAAEYKRGGGGREGERLGSEDSRDEVSRHTGEETRRSQTGSWGVSQRGLWGSESAGANGARGFGMEPKRRWTVGREEA